MKKLIIWTRDGQMYEASKNELTYQDGYISFTGEALLDLKLPGKFLRFGKFVIPFSNLSFVYESLTS